MVKGVRVGNVAKKNEMNCSAIPSVVIAGKKQWVDNLDAFVCTKVI